MDFGEILDFTAGIVIQAGNYFKIKKLPIGWLLSMLAILYWIFRAQTTGFVSQSFWHIFSFLVASYGFYSWRKDGNKEK